jgi:HK97 family phage major capsid protein
MKARAEMNREEFERRILEIEVGRAATITRTPLALACAALIGRTFSVTGNSDEHANPAIRQAADLGQRLHDLVERNYGQPSNGGVWFPFTVGDLRELNTTTDTALVNSFFTGKLVESLSPYSGVIAAGATVLPGLINSGKLIFPRVNTSAGVSWVSEGAPPPEADPEFGNCVIEPYTLAVNVPISRSFRASTTQAIQVAIAGDVQRAMWAEVDRVVLNGSGSSQPTGILNHPDIPSFAAGTDGGALDLQSLSEMEFELGQVYSGDPPSWFINSAIRRKAKQTPTGAGLAPLWADSRLMGTPTVVTENLPSDFTKGDGTDLSAAILGDFSRVVIGLWGAPAMEVLFNPVFDLNNGCYWLTIFLQVGVGFQRTEAFIACKDFDTTLA